MLYDGRVSESATTAAAPSGPLTYESEPAQHVVLGSVQASEAAWWSGSITLPAGSDLAFIALARHGPAARSDDGIAVSVPLVELPAVATLLSGLLAQTTGLRHDR
jgi:hypothetical protein